MLLTYGKAASIMWTDGINAAPTRAYLSLFNLFKVLLQELAYAAGYESLDIVD